MVLVWNLKSFKRLLQKFVDDLGADSLELFQILMGVEQEFDISIDEESLKDVDTVGDLLELIC